MTAPKASSVINPDIPPPPPPGPTIPLGNRSLSSDNSGGAFRPISSVLSGLPVNKVAVITQPPITNTNSLDSSIHARPLPAPITVASHDDKATQFNDIWAIICLGNSLRVYPASFSKSQRDSCREHVAILASIPKNIKEADLLEIASQVNAKTLNVPPSISSYKPKPYVYLNFSSFDTLEAAKEMTVAFRSKGLTWHSPNKAHTLCHVCGCPGCSPFVCNPRFTRKVDDRLNKLYSKFNAGPRRGHQDLHLSHDKSNSRSRSNNESSSGFTQSPHDSHPNSSIPTSPSNNSAYTLPQHIINDLKYRLSDLESMMGYDTPGDSDLYPPCEENEYHSYNNGWDDESAHNTNS
ncbi:hypothetical protein RhiirC2_791376 [Rhizophagus irregularis]|uniref:RRM domain-containing protein n=1 Tax=Rhizophagus irregularis TaxID=588596 RepID=A0A2N1MJB8_9GLOM|nr:hypothetical protein RhiirC2_791376 [Rhizophagus irregularis]